jgi:hypothetical protein
VPIKSFRVKEVGISDSYETTKVYYEIVEKLPLHSKQVIYTYSFLVMLMAVPIIGELISRNSEWIWPYFYILAAILPWKLRRNARKRIVD